MRKPAYILFTAWALAAVATACGDDDEYYQYGDFRYDMVTYAGANDDGMSVFSYQQRDDAGEITLITDSKLSLSYSAGQRMLLNYIPVTDVADGQQTVTAKGYTVAITDSLRYTSHANVVDMAMDSIKLKSIWRTGTYLNMWCQLKYTTQSRYMSLIMDYSTWQDDTVHCYLYHDMLGETTYFWRQAYLSFYIGSLWELESCKTMRIHLTDVADPDVEYYDFTKQE